MAGQKLPKNCLWRICIFLKREKKLPRVLVLAKKIIKFYFFIFYFKITGSIIGPAMAGPTGPFATALPYNTVPYNTFFNFIHAVFIQDQPASATCQAILSSVILAQYEGKKFPGEVGDILQKPEYKVHLEFNTKSDVPYNTMTCLLPSASKACRYDALTNHLLPFKIDISSL